ncbi:MAG: hypothetical protein DMG59_20695 [Acidobacteria bacterium]|nr:MAG: hypothetical protein DMG59_20695 [Acidobacteriota bacterium]
MRLSEVAGLGGAAVRRDGEFQNLGFLSDKQDGMLLFLESPRFARAVGRNGGVRAILTTPELAETIPARLALAVCEQPRLAFAAIHNALEETGFYWEEFATVIDPQAQVHPTAWIAPKNVRVARNSIVGPHATILERSVIGESVNVGAGAVLGGVGFQTVRTNQAWVEMRHAGGLTVCDGVHILPGAVIATGLFRDSTELSSEARVGSQAFISHGVRLGERAFVGHGAVVNGNVAIGKEAWVGPGAVIANNLEIGDHAFVSLGAVVIRNVPAGVHISGNFAKSHRGLLRSLAQSAG